jgi:oligopeptide/dipeptide ABC transporter ATP-binding protein
MSPLLEVSDVSIRFPTTGRITAQLSGAPRFIEAVSRVSFALEAGKTYAIVGESGSGKTTLVRSIIGLIPLHQGRIRFEGETISGLRETRLRAVRRDIAMIFQDPVGSLSPRLKIRTILAEPYRVHGETANLENKIAGLLADVGLPQHFAERYPHQLSGGQARRVSVARALALRPKLVIADEPTAGLDVSIQGEILNLMTRLKAELKLSYIIVTHNLAVIRHVSDRIAIMYLGRIVEEGPTSEVFGAARHPYTASLIASEPIPDPRRKRPSLAITGEVPSIQNRPKGCEFHTRCPFVQDRCRAEAPSLTSLTADHKVRCHYPLN